MFRRLLLVLTVALMMAAVMLVMAVPAFARAGGTGSADLNLIEHGPNAGWSVGGGGNGGFYNGGYGFGAGPNGHGGFGGNACN